MRRVSEAVTPREVSDPIHNGKNVRAGGDDRSGSVQTEKGVSYKKGPGVGELEMSVVKGVRV